MSVSVMIEPENSTKPQSGPTLLDRVRTFLVRRRVPISVAVFTALIAQDLLSRVRPHDILDWRDRCTVIGLLMITSGVLIRSFAAGILRKNSELTTVGIYGLVRHPLYFGSFLMMLGFCILIGDRENIWVVLGPMLALYLYRISREEKFLAAKFGGAWGTYAAAVPRFFPTRFLNAVLAPWNFKQWMKNKEYNAASAAALGLVGLQLWRHFLAG